MTTYDFDQVINRRQTPSAKWHWFNEDILPMWVADMDFQSPEPVIRALQERVAHGVFGYEFSADELSAVLCERMARLYNWTVTPEQILYLPGLVSGTNLVCRAMGKPGEAVLVQTPVYPPFLSAPANHGLTLQTADLTLITEGQTIRYEVDYDIFEAAITEQTRLFILCHPHNPIGESYRPEVLTRLAEICARHNIVICSDEIHCDLLLDGTSHTPMAALSPEIAMNCITLMAPSKTFNVPGLGCSFAIVQNPDLMARLKKAAEGIIPHVNLMGFTAALAAYRDGQEWLTQLLAYLTANRDFTIGYLHEHLPMIRHTMPEATYLMWLDCRELGLTESPYDFFLKEAKVALNNGDTFGHGGAGFVRFNFGCPRSLLIEGLERMRAAVNQLGIRN